MPRFLRLLVRVFAILGAWTDLCAALIFPENTLIQFVVGVTMPVAVTKRGGLAFNLGFQMNYAVPWNVTLFEPTIVSARHVRQLDVTLQDIYVAIEDLLDQYGWRDSRQCLLRTICELAATPLRRSRQDVLEEVIQLILTPTEDLPAAINSSYRGADKLYQEAERLGRSGGDCILTYSDCVESPLESFTEMIPMARRLLFFSLLLYCAPDASLASRSRRQKLYPLPLVYPFGGAFKLVVGITMPVEISGKILAYAQNFQFQYLLPQNATLFDEFFEDALSRRRRESAGPDERMAIYRILEEEFERRGINGRECVKKSICDAAMAPLQDEGLVGELLHLLLTPQREADSPLSSEYADAREFGRGDGDCSQMYESCRSGQGILERISKVV